MAFNYEKKYFYERNDWIYSPEINLKYEDVLKMPFPEFGKWVDFFRKTAIEQWNRTDAPPRIGMDEAEIIENFSKLQTYKVNEFSKVDKDGDEVIFNFNKFATCVNQFFPAMYKTGIGGSAYDNPKPSIYDIFVEDEYLPNFIKQMNRLTRQDGMYRFSKTLHLNHPDFHNSHIQSGKEWIEKWAEGDTQKGFGFCLSQADSKVPSPPITAQEVKDLYKAGVLTVSYTHLRAHETLS
jgi:hypothetical protein